MLEALGSISSTRRRRRRRKDKLWQEAKDWEDEDEPREIGQLSSSGKKSHFHIYHGHMNPICPAISSRSPSVVKLWNRGLIFMFRYTWGGRSGKFCGQGGL
jgi:hypothetical protein